MSGASGREVATPRGFLRGILVRAAPLLAAEALLNFLVNPFGTYPTRFFDPIILSTRRPKLDLYVRQKEAPRIVVLGSSRSFAAEPSYLEGATGKTAFNAAVHGAQTQDYLDLVQCFSATGRPFPDAVLVGLGVEQMLRGDGQGAERDDPLFPCSRGSSRSPLRRLDPFRGLLDAREASAAMRVLALEVTGRPEPAYTFGVEGQLRAGRRRHTLEENVDLGLAGNWRPDTFVAEGLNPRNTADLASLVRFCRDRGARVFVFLPPYHPKALARYLKESPFEQLHKELFDMLSEWASRDSQLKVFDFTRLESFGGEPDMFYDASHPSEAAYRRMFDVMLRDLH